MAQKLIHNHLDGILAHRTVASEISHKLGYVGSIETDVPAWKKARSGISAETDAEWWAYNGMDCKVTDDVIESIVPRMKARDQVEALKVHLGVQSMCVGLHRMGFLVDQVVRKELEVEYRNKAIAALKRIRSASGDPELNPNSVPQLRDLLFDKWDIQVGKGHRTKAGDPSTDDESIRDIAARLKSKKLRLKNQPQVVELIDALRKFRRGTKYLGTYIRKMVPFSQRIPFDDFSDDEDDVFLELDGDEVEYEYDRLDEDERARIKKRRSGSKKYGILFPDGRVHADFNAHGPSTQRISSSNCNMQNLPRALRKMLMADPALRHVLIYADMDQLELRFAAAIWNLRAYIAAFNTPGVDPHDLSATLIFGDLYSKMKPCDAKKSLRDFAKRFTYAVLYRATVETIHEVITSAEGQVKCACTVGTGGPLRTCVLCSGKGMIEGLPFANNKLEQTEQAYKDWVGNVPEIQDGWDKETAMFQKHGYLREPVLGFRCDFTDAGGDKDIMNMIANFRCQAGGAGLVHLGSIQFVKNHLPFDDVNYTGLVNQSHDALTGEVNCDCDPSWEVDEKGKKYEKHQGKCEAVEKAHALEECLTREVVDVTDPKRRKLPIKFTAKAVIMRHWQ